VWIGDTLEAAEPAAQDAPEENAAARAQPESPPAASEPVLRTKPLAVARPVVKPTTDPAGGSAVRAKIGGMAGNETEATARGFAKAFTRAVPAANSGDPVWGELPLGPVGSVRVSVTVGADGAIDDSKVLDKPRKPPPHLARFVDRTLILLRGGRFALTNGGAGTETLRVDVTLSERRMDDGPLALGFEAPSPGSPGRAYFQLASGRLVEAKVAVERR
jgi:hypothetical protein